MRARYTGGFGLVIGGLVVSGVLGLSGCGRSGTDGPEALPVLAPPATETTAAPKARIVILGDSLTAGFGLERDKSYPALLQRKLDGAGLAYQVVNAGISGDTSAGGVERFDWSVEGDTRIVIIALGANDGLRGLPLDQLEANLRALIERSKARGANVILAGLKAPTEAGPDYGARFETIYRKLAQQYQIPLIPSLLEGVAGKANLNQKDGIHPNEEGAALVAENVWKVLEPVARQAATPTPQPQP
ncbi:MAG: arylesterase [Chloracidobacterium sp.]|uniref:Arylesterase n=1 Tax=Chloracidobacterium validum TaxID=2821543 RepID=A0ABX8BF13_9BACT|nr:arylesterase [Chloracidobacterium validum]QUW03660.1 arylesterase [Chloracidobacterium validum]